MKFTPNGTEIYLQKLPASSAVVHPCTITNSAPAQILFVEGSQDYAEGDLITVSGTNTDLDGKTFILTDWDAEGGQGTLAGSDNTESVGAVEGSATKIATEDMERFCLSSWEYEISAADAIDVSTFCGTESLAGTPQPGTISIETYTDYDVDAQLEWMKGVRDGQRRIMRVDLPNDVDIVMTITPTGMTQTMDVNEAAAFSGEAVVNDWPVLSMPVAA